MADTFLPEADPAGTACDGQATQDNNATWAGARDAATADSVTTNDTATYLFAEYLASPNYYRIVRLFLNFDTSSIPDTNNIDSAKLTITPNTNSVDGYGDEYIHIVQMAPASNTTLAVGDYDSVVFTSLGSVTLGGKGAGTAFDINFNATGLTKINKTGITNLGLILGRDLTNTAPSAQGTRNYIQVRDADYTGTSSDPVLTVTHSAVVPSIVGWKGLLGVGQG